MIDMKEVIALAQAKQFDELTRRNVQITDGVLEEKEGWAKPCFRGMRAHYYIQVSANAIGRQGRYRTWKSVCGAETVTNDKAPMFAMGSWERCKLCMKKLNAARSRDATACMQSKELTRHASNHSVE